MYVFLALLHLLPHSIQASLILWNLYLYKYCKCTLQSMYCLIRFQFSVREMRYSNSTLTFFQKLLTFVLVNLTNHKPDSLLAPCPFHSSAACPAILALTPLFQSPCPKYLVFARSRNLIVCFLGESIARQSAYGFI